MRAPCNRRVFVVGYAAATPLGSTLERTWERARRGEAGFRRATRCEVDSPCWVVGEIPDWDPRGPDFSSEKEVYNWNAAYVILTMTVARDALGHARLEIDEASGPRTACLVGSSLNGQDAFRIATGALASGGPNKVSPFLLPTSARTCRRGRRACSSASPGRSSPRRARAPREPRDRDRRPDDPRRRLRLRPRRRRRHADRPRDHPRLREHERDDQGAGWGQGPRRSRQARGRSPSTARASSSPRGPASWCSPRRSSWTPAGSRPWPRCSASAGPRTPTTSPGPTGRPSRARCGWRSRTPGWRPRRSRSSTRTAPRRRRETSRRSSACARSSGAPAPDPGHLEQVAARSHPRGLGRDRGGAHDRGDAAVGRPPDGEPLSGSGLRRRRRRLQPGAGARPQPRALERLRLRGTNCCIVFQGV